MIRDLDPAELELHCPYPEREWCEGCPHYMEEDGICDLEC